MLSSLLSFTLLVTVASASLQGVQNLQPRQNTSISIPPSPGFEFLYSLNCTLDPPIEYGNGPRGPRRAIPIIGGTFAGPRVKGTLLNLGADWLWVDPKGGAHPDTRYALQTDDGANIYIQTFGSSQADGKLHLHGVFETGSETYWWMNDIVAVGILTAGNGYVLIDMFYITSPSV